MHTLLTFLLFIFSLICIGQPINPDEAEIYKLRNRIKPELILRADYFLYNHSRFFFESNYNFNSRYYLLNGSYRIYNQIGYQHYASDKWTLGISETYKIAYYPGIQSFVTSVNIAHTGKISEPHFIKELSADHYYYLQTNNGYKAPSQARLGGGILLCKMLPVAGSELMIAASCRAFLNHDFRDALTSIYRNRRIDLTRARIDVAYKITPLLWLAIYAMKETERYYTLGGSDAAGNTFPDYRVNRITPVLGAALNFVFKHQYAENFFPGLPFRH
ncbi:MAG: hypothetical protein NZ529_09200 [Cytophagaceae bacterium]|nr:hypothetical protein [Cytophagaceae bacterium]MDW8456960.1 hypothetical protein [Cytophagaceae bacterium]